MPKARPVVAEKSPKTRSAHALIFDQEYAKLNDAQKQAVDAIEGPVMVVAGPGTGKTQVVGMRVANILKRTQMRPANILCLTFSNSGATAMRDRLRLLIGADAYGVRVSTIHAFAQSIIDDHPIVFEDWSARQQLTDIEKYKFLNTIIDQLLPQMDLINPKDPHAKSSDLLERISQVKREGKTVADLERVSAAFETEMQGKSKEGTKAHEKNLLTARKFKDFVEIFRRYQQKLEDTGRYDYDDMILVVLRALAEEDWLLASLQERYQYILVDEFQDTNGSQYELIERMTTYPALDHAPNLFVVGDDDQAIYRFQGANLQNMLSWHKCFPNAPVIPLTVSYRSTQPILDAARTLIERNEERLVGKIPHLQKLLTAATKERGGEPQLLRPASDAAEPWLIADIIDDRLKKNIPPEEIAVLAQTNAELVPLYDTLRSRDIPVLLEGKADLLSHSLVLEALAILRAIEKPHRDALLSGALSCSCFDLHPADLGRIAAAARDEKTSIQKVLLNLENNSDLGLSDHERIIAARDTLLDLHNKIPVRPVLETVEYVLRECVVRNTKYQIPNANVDPLDLATVEAFFNYVRLRCLEKPSYAFEEFLGDIEFFANPTFSHARLTYELPHLVTSGVKLMTAHQSKGQEFTVVILTNFRDGHWDKRRNRSSVALPEDLLFGWEREQKSFEQHQDERRIAFVGMTRAKRELLMICAKELTVGQKTRSVAPSAFFAEMGTLPEHDVALRDPEAASLLLHPVVRLPDAELTAYLRHRLESFALSATSLNRFLQNPQEFLLIDLLQQPQHFDEGMIRRFGYGNAVHWALREWAVRRQRGEALTIEAFIEAFNWYLKERTILTDKQREDLLAFGTASLPRYFTQQLATNTPFIHAVEREYRGRIADGVSVDGIPLKGKIDRIDLLSETSGRATVIDYKTGAAKSESDIRGGLDPDVVSRTEDGANFRQLAFYSLLLEQAEPLLQPEAFILDFIGERGEHPTRRSFAVTDREKDDLRQLIRDVWKKVTALDFTNL